jgi:hypothetical protein
MVGLEDHRGVAYQDLASWSRFTVKQTYDKLKPKRTFTPHVSNHTLIPKNWNADIAIHGSQSTRHGWEWYEMGFFTYWNQSNVATLLCFDLPAKLLPDIQSVFGSQSNDSSCPYSAFSLISDALLRLYDDSVWSIRNHISQWEAVSFILHIHSQVAVRLIRNREGYKRQTTFFCMKLRDTVCMLARL